MRPIGILFVLFLVLSLSACAQRIAPLENPEEPLPEIVTEGMSMEAIAECVHIAAERRDWVPIPSAEPGVMSLYRYIRNHGMEVTIYFDRETVRAEYLDSENMLYREDGRLPSVYKDGRRVAYAGPVIHRAYNDEVRQLVRAIRRDVTVRRGDC